MNSELTICLGETVWVCAQAISAITDTLIIAATTMHGFNSGIYPGVGVPEAFQTAYFDFLRRLWTTTNPPPPHTTIQA